MLESWHWFHSWDLLIQIWLDSSLCYPWAESWTLIPNKVWQWELGTAIYWGRSVVRILHVQPNRLTWAQKLVARGLRHPWRSDSRSLSFLIYKMGIISLTAEPCDEKWNDALLWKFIDMYIEITNEKCLPKCLTPSGCSKKKLHFVLMIIQGGQYCWTSFTEAAQHNFFYITHLASFGAGVGWGPNSVVNPRRMPSPMGQGS